MRGVRDDGARGFGEENSDPPGISRSRSIRPMRYVRMRNSIGRPYCKWALFRPVTQKRPKKALGCSAGFPRTTLISLTFV